MLSNDHWQLEKSFEAVSLFDHYFDSLAPRLVFPTVLDLYLLTPITFLFANMTGPWLLSRLGFLALLSMPCLAAPILPSATPAISKDSLCNDPNTSW
jgi:hypothetical protein